MLTGAIGSGRGTYDIHNLANCGLLSIYARTLPDTGRRLLRADAYRIVWPLVYQHLTRRLELNRGHNACAAGFHRLAPGCLDRFHDDVEAVLDDLLCNAKVPIANLEGWVTRRLNAATINAHRRRRGERGAMQRPRLPGWLAAALGYEPTLVELAIEMLVWVGVEATAGLEVWPMDAWTQRRAVQTGDHEGARRAVTGDVATVLAAMQRRPKWYARYVERPLGHKQLPVVHQRMGEDPATEPGAIGTSEHHEAEDARMLELASAAVDAIDARIQAGEEPAAVVVEVLRTVFGSGTGVEDIDRYPGGASGTDEVVAARLAEPATVDRIVAVVLDIVSSPRS